MCCYWPLFMFTCFVVCIVCHLNSIPLMDLEGSPRHQGISIWKRQMCKLCISPGDWYSPCSPRPCSFRTPIFLTCWRINRGERCNVATCVYCYYSACQLYMTVYLLGWIALLQNYCSNCYLLFMRVDYQISQKTSCQNNFLMKTNAPNWGQFPTH